MFLFSVGTTAMNAPRYWQWCNERAAAVGNCAKTALRDIDEGWHWLGRNNVSRGFSSYKWKMTIKRVLLTFNIFQHLSCLSHSLSSLCVAYCIYTLVCINTVQCRLPMQFEEGGGGGRSRGSTKRMGNLSSALEKADNYTVSLSLQHDKFHARLGNLFPNRLK
jgi:hypothetical protein